ncbi:MAG TPA: hypothetical protein VK849_10290, partial [Longimicrobiales bacterium]|nr:hypothetical protein [Longimicrobiales bacterium]
PVPALAVAGAALGHHDDDRLRAAVEGAAIWTGVGALGGAALGRLLWGGREGTWSGVLVGAALGALVGGVGGALAFESPEPTPMPLPLFALRLGVGP